MTIKGYNWLAFGALLALTACDTATKDTADDGFDTIGDNEEADADADADADGDADADSDADADADGGDGTLDVDQLVITWDGVYADGDHTGATYVNAESGEVEELETSIQFIFVDNTDFNASGGNENYLCRVIYDLPSVSSTADFSALEGGDQTYMGFNIDSGAATPEYSGNCDDAAFAFGVSAMGDYVNASAWGYGYGPMYGDLEDVLSDADGWAELGDTPGAMFLKWDNADGTVVTGWGYFQAYGFSEGNLVDFSAGAVAGVRDSASPADGYYNPSTAYVLTFGG